jgi:hypothetical protein
MKLYAYDITEFNFKEQLQTVLNTSNLDNLDENKDIERLYSDYLSGKQFLDMYVQFIRKYITELYNGVIAYQTKPVCRLVYKNKLNMHKLHKDKWYRKNTIYSDIQIENIFLPFTNAFDSNSIWTESVEDQHDFSPIKCDYGQFVHWDGNNLLHGNVINKSGNSRVSIDFRVYKYKNLLHPEYTLLNF